MTQATIMSQKDRTELRRIVKARFAILQSQLRTRQQELQHTLREQVEAEYASEIERAQKKSQKILEKARKLEDEARELEQEMRGIGISPGSGYRTSLFSFQFTDQWSPTDLDKRVSAAYNKLTEAAGLHKQDLQLRQLELEEELAIGALGSDEAKGFLDKVPTIDTLLPLNGNVAKVLAKGPVIENDDIIEGDSGEKNA